MCVQSDAPRCEFVGRHRLAIQQSVLASDVFDRVQAASCPHEVRDVGAFHDRVETR